MYVLADLPESKLDAMLQLISSTQTQIQDEIPSECTNVYFDLLEVCMIVKFVFDTGCSPVLARRDRLPRKSASATKNLFDADGSTQIWSRIGPSGPTVSQIGP